MGNIKDILNNFIKDDLYYATESFLKKCFGIVIRSNNPNCAENEYFQNNETNYQYVKKALEKIESIMPMGNISRDTFLKGKSNNVSPIRYDTIKVFACEAKESISRDDIAALTRAFNRIHSATDEIYQTKNRPVIVLFRQRGKLSISTCERTPKTDQQDYIGKVIILHNIDCEKPRQGHLQILGGMAKEIKRCSTYDELFQKLLKSLSIDIVSDNFFKGYTNLFKEIVKYASSNARIKKEFHIFPDPMKAVRDYVKIFMGRIVFIQFLQRKGWMGVPVDDDSWTDGDPEFLQNLFERSDKKDVFINEVLRPLFNDLNTKRDGDLASKCIRTDIKIPYLNGGLFDKDEYEDVRFSLPGDLMKKTLDFFRSYNFTIDENVQDSVEVGVDPEMLSRIFESLLEDNNATGAFYTPKSIVDYMCREALITYLQTGITDESTKTVYKNFVTNHMAEDLTPDVMSYLDNKLRNVKICDPAIGSGAFPMGMLKELFECRKALEIHMNGGECNPSEIKKDIIQNSIYGVDIEKGAVDIARLRFWLSLIIDEKTPDALPNMDFKIMQGNSLLEQYEGVDLSDIEITETQKKGKKKGKSSEQTFVFEEKDAIKNIQIAINNYYKTDKHETKELLRKSINDNVKDYICHMKGFTPEIQKKIKKLSIPNDLFFLWHIYFKEVFDTGGFDIVIGNPPYIELQKMKKMSQVYEKCGFTTYNKTGDIYCLFTEQGMNLLKEGGTLCYIMMNKWMKAEYGQQLRKYILGRKIHNIVDFGDVQVFKKATTYVCIVLLGNSKPEATFRASYLKTFDLGLISDLSEEYPASDFDDDIWVLTSKQDLELFKKLKATFPTLKDYLKKNCPKYGIKPGLSEAFLISEETRNGIIKQCSSAKDVIVPFLSGKDIKPYEPPQFSGYLILFKKGDTLRLMGRNEATEEEAWRFIRDRYPSVCDWLKQFKSKAKNRSDKGDFWWELRACDYYSQFGMPKIMYQTFQVKPNFIYDTMGSFCNNSMWILPTENKALLGLFNSKIGWWLISNYCSQIQSGYQLIWDYFSRIPVALKHEGNEEIAKIVDDILSANEKNNEDATTDLQKIDGCLYELYGLTNGEVKVIDREIPTFGADFELYKRKPNSKLTSDAELDRIFSELKDRFDKLSRALDNEETNITGIYDPSCKTKPSKEELEDAFNKWNCAILTAFRGSDTLSKEDNLSRNIRRNEELKAKMREMGLLFRPVDGYYVEIEERGTEIRRVPVNELSYFVISTDEEGDLRTDDVKKKDFFTKMYRLAEHYEQDSFLFTFPGANRVAFLVATNGSGRSYFRNDIKFAGPLFTDIEGLDAWTGCSDDGKIAFMLKGMVQKKVPGHDRRIWIGEGDIFDIGQYHPDCLVVIHDKMHDVLNASCAVYKKDHDNLYEYAFEDEGVISVDDIRMTVERMLDALPNRRNQIIGFHCSVPLDGSYVEGAKIAYKTIQDWVKNNLYKLSKIVIVDVYGDYCKIQN